MDEIRTDREQEQWMLRGPGGRPEIAGSEDCIYGAERGEHGRRVRE